MEGLGKWRDDVIPRAQGLGCDTDCDGFLILHHQCSMLGSWHTGVGRYGVNPPKIHEIVEV